MARHFSEYPHMIFVDGENFTIQGQNVAEKNGVKLLRGERWERDTFLWIPNVDAVHPTFHFNPYTWGRTLVSLTGNDRPPPRDYTDTRAQRSYYFTAVTGDDKALKAARLALSSLGFDPQVFKKPKGSKSKGVDVSLTSTLVSHAYRDNYKVAYLIAGDGDYVPMVEEAKRAGKWVAVAFFEEFGLNDDLRITADIFLDLTPIFLENWTNENKRVEKEAASAAAEKKTAAAEKRKATAEKRRAASEAKKAADA